MNVISPCITGGLGLASISAHLVASMLLLLMPSDGEIVVIGGAQEPDCCTDGVTRGTFYSWRGCGHTGPACVSVTKQESWWRQLVHLGHLKDFDIVGGTTSFNTQYVTVFKLSEQRFYRVLG